MFKDSATGTVFLTRFTATSTVTVEWPDGPGVAAWRLGAPLRLRDATEPKKGKAGSTCSRDSSPVTVLRTIGKIAYSVSAVIAGAAPSPKTGISRPNSANDGMVSVVPGDRERRRDADHDVHCGHIWAPQ